MRSTSCTSCPVMEAAEALCKDIEKAIPFLFAPPRHPCKNHLLIEAVRDQLMAQVYKLRRGTVCVYPPEDGGEDD